MNTGKVLLSVLAGVAAGALLGILLAPDKGSKTRKQILEKGEGYADALKEKFDDLVDTISKNFDGTKEEAGDLVSKGKTKYDDVKKEAKQVTN